MHVGTMPLARSNPKQTSHLGKLAAYQEIIEHRLFKAHLGLPNLFVLTVMTDAKRLSETVRLSGANGGNPFFLFRTVGQLTEPVPGLLFEPWERAGYAPLSIAESH
jgi:hypothetical protein